jgi:lincosamide nucleotidyltransferase A/C/D/E
MTHHPQEGRRDRVSVLGHDRRMRYREMTRPDVLAFLDLTDDLGIGIWLDGGWGVDALLGTQTRRHEDLDIVLEARHSATLVQHLSLLGFRPAARDDAAPWNFALGDDHGREVDLHVVEFTGTGDALMGPSSSYPRGSLDGYGTIGARTVRCVAPAWAVRFHTGYEVDERDWSDVARLCERYDLPVPPEYDRFR